MVEYESNTNLNRWQKMLSHFQLIKMEPCIKRNLWKLKRFSWTMSRIDWITVWNRSDENVWQFSLKVKQSVHHNQMCSEICRRQVCLKWIQFGSDLDFYAHCVRMWSACQTNENQMLKSEISFYFLSLSLHYRRIEMFIFVFIFTFFRISHVDITQRTIIHLHAIYLHSKALSIEWQSDLKSEQSLIGSQHSDMIV